MFVRVHVTVRNALSCSVALSSVAAICFEGRFVCVFRVVCAPTVLGLPQGCPGVCVEGVCQQGAPVGFRFRTFEGQLSCDSFCTVGPVVR